MTILPAVSFPAGGVTYYVPIEFTDTASRLSIIGVKVPTNESYVDTP